MMRFIVSLLLAVVLALALSAPAQAGYVSLGNINAEAGQIAQTFWGERGRTPDVSRIELSAAPCGSANNDGCANRQTRAIQVRTTLMFYAMADMTIDGRSAQARVCAVIVHEYGHLGGIWQHTDTGVMRSPLSVVYSDWPWACKVWAARR